MIQVFLVFGVFHVGRLFVIFNASLQRLFVISALSAMRNLSHSIRPAILNKILAFYDAVALKFRNAMESRVASLDVVSFFQTLSNPIAKIGRSKICKSIIIGRQG